MFIQSSTAENSAFPYSPGIGVLGEDRILEMMASGQGLGEILATLCRGVEDAVEGCRCGVYLIGRRGSSRQNGAAPSLPADFNDSICAMPTGCDAAPCTRAACLKTQVIAEDVESDPLWRASPFRPLALSHGLWSCWSTPIYGSAGHVLATLDILHDHPASPARAQQTLIAHMTHMASIAIERAGREAAFRRGERLLAETQRLSATGSFCWLVSTDEIDCSEQLHRILEIERDVPITLDTIRSRVHAEDKRLFDRMVERARNAAGTVELEPRLMMPDGSVRRLHLAAHPIRDSEGPLEYLGVVQDVTQRWLADETLARARAELARAGRVMSLGALTASIAHEVNQPLSGIITNASTCLRVLAAEPADLEAARETAKRTLRDAHRAADVIARLRALFAKKTAASEIVYLNHAAEEAIALSSSDLQRRRVTVRQELAEGLPPVVGDRIQLQQVVVNLLLNAADAMSAVEDRPRLLVIKTATDSLERVCLCVEDSGVGLEACGKQLFEAFYTTKSDGMGIGLFVSRFIIESHHGRLWAANNDGPGASFSFSIPCAVPPGQRAHSIGHPRSLSA